MSVIAIVAIPIGTLTRTIHSQPKPSVSAVPPPAETTGRSRDALRSRDREGRP